MNAAVRDAASAWSVSGAIRLQLDQGRGGVRRRLTDLGIGQIKGSALFEIRRRDTLEALLLELGGEPGDQRLTVQSRPACGAVLEFDDVKTE